MASLARAQVAAIDLLTAFTFLAMLLLAFGVSWNYSLMQIAAGSDELQLSANLISDYLLNSPGLPNTWNQTNFSVPGLAEHERGVISESHLYKLVNTSNYTGLREAFGVPLYDFSINVTYLNGTVATASGQNATLGIAPVTNTTRALARRVALYKGSRVIVNIIVWK